MILNTITSLRPARLIVNLQALQSNHSKIPFKHFCAQSGHQKVEKSPTHGDPGQANKLLYQLFGKHVGSKYQKGFQEALPNVIKGIQELPEYRDSAEVKERLEQIILYNSPSYTQFCGIQAIAVSEFYDGLRNHTVQDENHLQKIYTLAWCTELNAAAFIMKDDIADGSTLRYGQPTWHTIQGPNTPSFMAVNDALLLEQAAHALVEKTFEDHPAQQKLSQSFRQTLALCTASNALENIMNLTFKTTGKISSMRDYCWMRKVQNGSLQALPIKSVAILNGITNALHLEQLTTVCMDTLLFFAIQRDYMDSFQKVKHVGNDGTDIKNARITWLLITAFEKASPAQRKQLQDNIGKSTDSNVAAVIEVFQELDIPKLHKDWQQNFFEQTTKKINNLPETLPREIFQMVMNLLARALPH